MGNNKIKKVIKRDTMFIEKTSFKHSHEYNIECLLEITNINKHASFYYQCKSYYHVMKCSYCNSFKSISEDGNCQGHIFDEIISEELKQLPIIKAETTRKNPIYPFCELLNVKFDN